MFSFCEILLYFIKIKSSEEGKKLPFACIQMNVRLDTTVGCVQVGQSYQQDLMNYELFSLTVYKLPVKKRIGDSIFDTTSIFGQ